MVLLWGYMDNEKLQDLLKEESNATHGGSRPGSGRKANPNKKVAYTTKLRPDQVEWLRSLKNAASTLEKLIDSAM